MQQMELVLVGYFLDDNISKTFVKCCKFIKVLSHRLFHSQIIKFK